MIDRFGSVKAALAVVRRVTGDETWQAARAAATDDLTIYLALASFGGRPRFTRLPSDAQLDVKAFYGSYKEACAAAEALLFHAGDQDAVRRACQEAPVGKLTREALYVHRSALERLSPLLRVYEGAGARSRGPSRAPRLSRSTMPSRRCRIWCTRTSIGIPTRPSRPRCEPICGACTSRSGIFAATTTLPFCTARRRWCRWTIAGAIPSRG